MLVWISGEAVSEPLQYCLVILCSLAILTGIDLLRGRQASWPLFVVNLICAIVGGSLGWYIGSLLEGWLTS